MNTLLFRQPRIFALIIGMIMIVGASSYSSIGRQEDPTITNLFASVITPFPGADPIRVEALVTKKLEDKLKEISDIKKINSTSRTGISVVQIQLSDFISDDEIEQTWAEVRDAINDARTNMPKQVGISNFDNDRTGAFTLISSISAKARMNAEGGIRPINHVHSKGNLTTDISDKKQVATEILLRHSKILQDRLRQVSGTDIVSLFGAPKEAIYVELNDADLIALGITVKQIAASISAADAKVMAGRIQQPGNDVLIEVIGEIKSLSRISEIPIKTQSNGQQILLGDVAQFRRGIELPRSKLALSRGKESILVAAKMKPDLQVDKWTEKIYRVIQDFESELPVDIEHQIVFSQNEYTQSRLSEVFVNMLLGVSLVIIVLFFTLGWRSAIVVAIVLPLTSLGSLSVLQFIGVSIHQMSVTGLIVALGLLVDAAIVMTDDIGKRIRRGSERIQAVGDAVVRLKAPLLASTVTTALAFTPMALLPGPAGDFVGSIAISVIVMLVVSLLLALTVTPAIAGWLLTEEEPQSIFSSSFNKIRVWFVTSMDWALQFPRSSVAIACALPLAGFIVFPTLTAQFFPGVDRDQLYIQIESDNGSSFHKTELTTRKADTILQRFSGVQGVEWVIGESAPPFYYNMRQNRDNDRRFAEGLVTTESPEATERLVTELQKILDAELPDAQVLVRGLVQGPPINAPVEFKVLGPDLAVLRAIGNQIRQKMSLVGDILHSRSSLNGGAPKLVFNLEEARVKQAGYDLVQVASSLNASLSGVAGGSLIDGTEEVPVIVRLEDAQRTQFASFSQLKLPIPMSDKVLNSDRVQYIPLSSFGEYQLTPSKSPILRKNGERINTIQGFIRHGVLPEEVLKQVQQQLELEPIELPPGYRIEIGGDADARSETAGNLMSSMGLIITLSIATIVLTFNSFRLSLVTGLVSVLSMGLSLFALAVFNYPFGIQALIGVIGSIGVSINAAIIILTALQKDPAAVGGDTLAIRNQVLDSSRHIVSTTITTFGGFLPLLLAGGGFWPPFAMAIAGGVLLSTVVSFYFTPPMFCLIYTKASNAAATAG